VKHERSLAHRPVLSLAPASSVAVLEATAEHGARHIVAQLPDPARGRATDRHARPCSVARRPDSDASLELPRWTAAAAARTRPVSIGHA